MTRPTDEIDSRIDLDRILAALPPQQRRAVSLYSQGFTQAEIAHKFGVHQSTICRLFVKLCIKNE